MGGLSLVIEPGAIDSRLGFFEISMFKYDPSALPKSIMPPIESGIVPIYGISNFVAKHLVMCFAPGLSVAGNFVQLKPDGLQFNVCMFSLFDRGLGVG